MRNHRCTHYAPLMPGANVLLQTDPARGHDRRYLRELAETVDLGGMTITTRRPLSLGTLVRLQLSCPTQAGDEPPFRARGLVRSRRSWFGRRVMALQFLDFEDLGARSLASCMAAVLGAADPSPLPAPAGAASFRQRLGALLGAAWKRP